MSNEKRNARRVRIPSFEIEATESKKAVLLENKYRTLTELGVYKQREEAQKTQTLVQRGKFWGFVAGYAAGVVPDAHVMHEVHKWGETIANGEYADTIALVTGIAVMVPFAYAGYRLGAWQARRISMTQNLATSG